MTGLGQTLPNWRIKLRALRISNGVEDAGQPMGDEGKGHHQEEQHGGPIFGKLFDTMDDSQQAQQTCCLQNSCDLHSLHTVLLYSVTLNLFNYLLIIDKFTIYMCMIGLLITNLFYMYLFIYLFTYYLDSLLLFPQSSFPIPSLSHHYRHHHRHHYRHHHRITIATTRPS